MFFCLAPLWGGAGKVRGMMVRGIKAGNHFCWIFVSDSVPVVFPCPPFLCQGFPRKTEPDGAEEPQCKIVPPIQGWKCRWHRDPGRRSFHCACPGLSYFGPSARVGFALFPLSRFPLFPALISCISCISWLNPCFPCPFASALFPSSTFHPPSSSVGGTGKGRGINGRGIGRKTREFAGDNQCVTCCRTAINASIAAAFHRAGSETGAPMPQYSQVPAFPPSFHVFRVFRSQIPDFSAPVSKNGTVRSVLFVFFAVNFIRVIRVIRVIRG